MTCAAYAAGTQLSQAECDTVWGQANAGGAATINQSQAQPYVTDFAADADHDGSLTKAEFLSACKSGLVKSSASTGAATGESGSANPGNAPAKIAPAPNPLMR